MKKNANTSQFSLDEATTRSLVKWAENILKNTQDEFEAARLVAERLGVFHRDGKAEVGFWAPEIIDKGIADGSVFLELFQPQSAIDFKLPNQEVTFHREMVPLVRQGEYLWGVIEGMTPGSKDQAGTFYWVKYFDKEGNAFSIIDYLSFSVPFGVFAPAEYFDFDAMLKARKDFAYFDNLEFENDPDRTNRVPAPVNINQIHPKSASEGGTIEELTERFRTISEKLERGEKLTSGEECFTSYEAIQLLPVEPTIEYESGEHFWNLTEEEDNEVKVSLKRSDIVNWGYDVAIGGASALNPAILKSGRPNEFLELIEMLHHAFPKPIKIVLDIVYGHVDNQALKILDRRFFAGPGMYGQSMNFKQPTVRAIMLETQRRKGNYGVDGFRVDGAQDFKYWDAEKQELFYDDEYLECMNDIVQEVGEINYRPFMVFEDGRPWPREDWSLASNYLEVQRRLPNVKQWGPLTFANNTSTLFTFWLNRFWRVQQIAKQGSSWITGCANHDTLRRGAQINPYEENINTYLGDNFKQIIAKGYDNPAAKLFDYACMPGIPMDFLNASMRTPWGFLRNTDDQYGVKVVAEEKFFLDWFIDEESFTRSDFFTQLKDKGFKTLEQLKKFKLALFHSYKMTSYNLGEILQILKLQKDYFPVPKDIGELKAWCRAFMEDAHETCRVTHYFDKLDSQLVHFNKRVRDFRIARPWLANEFSFTDHFDRLYEVEGTVIYYGLRTSPDGHEKVLVVANMEGAPYKMRINQIPLPEIEKNTWEVALTSPGIVAEAHDEVMTFRNSEGVIFTVNV